MDVPPGPCVSLRKEKDFLSEETRSMPIPSPVCLVYLAGPLFTEAETQFNLSLEGKLQEAGYSVFLPQRECQGKPSTEIYEICKGGLSSARAVVAILDGADADSGTCWECGYAVAKGIPVIAVRTDFRQSGDTGGFNAMLFFSSAQVIEGTHDLGPRIAAALGTLTGPKP